MREAFVLDAELQLGVHSKRLGQLDAAWARQQLHAMLCVTLLDRHDDAILAEHGRHHVLPAAFLHNVNFTTADAAFNVERIQLDKHALLLLVVMLFFRGR